MQKFFNISVMKSIFLLLSFAFFSSTIDNLGSPKVNTSENQSAKKEVYLADRVFQLPFSATLEEEEFYKEVKAMHRLIDELSTEIKRYKTFRIIGTFPDFITSEEQDKIIKDITDKVIYRFGLAEIVRFSAHGGI
jgi:hypothetical protein